MNARNDTPSPDLQAGERLANPAAAKTSSSSSPPTVRLWPGVAIVAGMLVMTQVLPRLMMRTVAGFLCMMSGAPLGALLLIIWWVRFSRVRGRDRWVFPLIYFCGGLGLLVTLYWGPPAPFVMVLGLPLAAFTWIAALAGMQGRIDHWRNPALAGAILAGWGLMAAVRIDGADGDLYPQIAFRWSHSSEDVFLAQRQSAGITPARSVVTDRLQREPGDWSGFRGEFRNGINETDEISPDWRRHPPREVWRRRIGPAWSSMTIVSGHLFTQEQRGEEECVTAYDAMTGQELWSDGRAARFVEAISGAGPRATPTFAAGRLYSYGATGWLTCHDAGTGRLIWSVDTRTHGAQVPSWGMAGSPLVNDRFVLVYLGGGEGKGLGAFDTETGALAWTAGAAAHSYSSVTLATIGGVRQCLFLSDYGIESFEPGGRPLWSFEWSQTGINRDVQPIVDGNDVLISTGIGSDMGLKRIRVEPGPEHWSAAELWKTRSLRPYYNDCVVLDGCAFGFDQNIFTCVRLADGQRAWRQGRYGSGQVLLLSRQKLLLVQAETGEVVLLAADPAQHRELARITALTAKTWNHPVVAHGRLYVRNAEEMACFELAPPDEHSATQ